MTPSRTLSTSLLAVLLIVLPAVQPAAHASSNPVVNAATEAAGNAADTVRSLVPWDQLPWHSQQEMLDAVKGNVDMVDRAVAGELSNRTGFPIESLLDLVPLLHDALVSVLLEANRTATEEWQAIEEAIRQVPIPGVDAEPPPTTNSQFVTMCQMGSTGLPTPSQGDLCFVVLLVTGTIAQFVNRHKLFCLDLDEEDALAGCNTRQWEEAAGEIIRMLDDLDGDGLNNLGEFRWEHVPVCVPLVYLNCMDFEKNQTTGAGGDEWWDGAEVRYWNNPANDPLLGFLELDVNATVESANRTANSTANGTASAASNATRETGDRVNETLEEHEEDASEAGDTANQQSMGGASPGPGNNNPPPGDEDDDNGCTNNCGGCTSDCGGGGDPGCTTDCPLPDPSDPPEPEDIPRKVKMLLMDPDRELDTDGDGLRNSNDPDSDNDGILDGVEYRLTRTYPEFADSDCSILDGACTPSTNTTYYNATSRQGTPGTGDGMNDSVEIQVWNTILGQNAWALDCDRDGITNILDPDSDNDGVRDGDEIVAGTNPCSGYDGPTSTVAKMDPTNLNLPLDLMDPATRSSLENNLADAQAQANETVAIVDELISAAIAGNVTRALNVIYNETPIGPPLRSATQMVQMTHDAVLNIVKCTPEGIRDAALLTVEAAEGRGSAGQTAVQDAVNNLPTPGLLGQAQGAAGALAQNQSNTDPLLALAPAVVEAAAAAPARLEPLLDYANTTNEAATELPGALLGVAPRALNATQDPQNATADVDEMAGCTTSVLIPFLDALLNRTLESIPIVGDLAANLRDETLPQLLDTADEILPISIQATTKAFLARPIATTTQTALWLPEYASDPKNLENAVMGAKGAIDRAIQKILKPSSRHPQMLYDLAASHDLLSTWEEVASINREAGTLTGGRLDAIATVDSVSFNLYTNRSGTERITAVPVGTPTCIQLDDSTATRFNDCDLYATLAFSSSASPTSVTAPSAGKRFTPTLTLTKAKADAVFPLEALGYLQLPNAPYILVMGFNTNQAGANPGMPNTWEGTLHDFDTAETLNRTLSFTTSFTDTRLAIPLHLVAAAFRVDTNAPGKPPVGDNETVLEAVSSAMPNRLGIDIQRTQTASQALATTSITTSASADLDVVYHDVVGKRDGVVTVQARGLPAGASKAIATYENSLLSWTWASPGTTQVLNASYQEKQDTTTWVRAYELNTTSLPATLALSSNAQSHLHGLQASSAAATLRFLVLRGTKECQGLSTARAASFAPTGAQGCMTGNLDGYSQLLVQDTASMARVTGTRTPGDSLATAVQVTDGNGVYFHTDASATSWDAQLQLAGNKTQDLQWTSAAASPLVLFRADLNQGARHALLDARLEDAPTTAHTVLDLVSGQGTMDASNYVTEATMAFSTTGNAPTVGSDHLRLRILPVQNAARDVESSWSMQNVKTAYAQILPNGTFEVKGDFSQAHPLSVLFVDDTHKLALDTTSVVGKFGFWLTEDNRTGRFSYHQQANTPASHVSLAGSMPGGRVSVDLTDSPARVHATAALANHTISVDASGAIGAADIRYAPGGTAPTLPDPNYLALQDDGGAGKRGFAIHAAGFQRLAAAMTAGQLVADTAFTTASPLMVSMTDGQEPMTLWMQAAPTHAVATAAVGSFVWSATSGTSFNFTDILESAPRYTQVSATGAPAQLTVAWTARPTASFDATITHTGSNLPALSLDAYEGIPASTGDLEKNGWSLNGADLPASSTIRLDALRGSATLTEKTASGAAAVAGHIDAAFAAHAPSLLTLPAGTQGVLLDQSGNALAGTLNLDAVKSLDASLLPDPSSGNGLMRINLQRTQAGTVQFKAHSEKSGQDSTVNLANAASSLTTTLLAGALAQDGFAVTSTASAASGPMAARLVRSQGSDVAFQTDSTPATASVSWSARKPLVVNATAPFTSALQFASSLAGLPAAAGSDYASIKFHNAQDASPVASLHLTGVKDLVLDPLGNRLTATGNTAANVPFLAQIIDDTGIVRVQISDLTSRLVSTWSVAPWSLHLDTSQALGYYRLMPQPASESAARILVTMDGIAAGVTDFTLDAGGHGFNFISPGSVTRLRIAADKGGANPLQGLDEEGVYLDASDASLRLNLTSVHHAAASANPGAAPWLDSDAPAAARFRLNAGQLALATVTAGSGAMHLAWPNPSGTAATMTASSIAGRNVWMGWTSGDESMQATLTGAPASWSLAFSPLGELDSPASSSYANLVSSGVFKGASYTLTAANPNAFDLTPQLGLLSGTLTTAGSIGRMTLALAPAGHGGGGQLPVPTAPGSDLFTIDTTEGSGQLYLDLPNLQGASWGIPNTAAQATTGSIHVVLDMAAGTSRPAVLQFVHPYYQAMVRQAGLDSHLDVAIERSTAQWLARAGATGRLSTIQYHEGAGSMRIELGGVGQVTWAPRANRVLSWSGQANPVLRVDTDWNGGYVKADLTNVAGQLVVDTNGLLASSGQVSTLGSGGIAVADLLVVPSSSGAVNRVTSSGDYAAVNLVQTPYVALHLKDMTTFGWTLPANASKAPMRAEVSRTQASQGTTLVSLSGPREDVTALLVDPAAQVSLQAYESRDPAPPLGEQQQASQADGPDSASGSSSTPAQVSYTSNGGSTGRVDLTRVDANSGKLLTSYIVGAQGTTNLGATGAEPARITIDSTQSQGAIGFQITDAGTGLRLESQNPAPHMDVTALRATCGATSPERFTINTGGAFVGPTFVQIGDQSRVPADHQGSSYVNMRCDGQSMGVGLRVPAVQNLWMQEEQEASCVSVNPSLVPVDSPLSKFSVSGIPSNTPVPITKSDERGDYEIQIRGGGATGGFLRLTVDCNHLQYWFSDVIGNPIPMDGITLKYARAQQNSGSATGSNCIQFDHRCINHLALTGLSLPSTAAATFKKPGAQPNDNTTFLKLEGGHGTLLDLELVVEKDPNPQPSNRTDLEIYAAMSLDSLRFIKRDGYKSFYDPAARNAVVLQKDADQDTLFVKLENLDSANVEMHKRPGSSHLNVEYHGDSRKAFEFYSTQETDRRTILGDHDTTKVTLSNTPDSVRLGISKDCGAEGREPLIIDGLTSHAIGSLQFYSRSQGNGTPCKPANSPPSQTNNTPGPPSLMTVNLASIPAGQLSATTLFGSAGAVKLHASGGNIGRADVGWTEVGDSTKYANVHLQNVRVDVLWDLDGDTRFPGDPYYITCDTGGSSIRGNIEFRDGAFGVLFALDSVACDSFVIKWHYVPIQFGCWLACAYIPFPVISRDGYITLGASGKIIYGGSDWKIPDKLFRMVEG